MEKKEDAKAERVLSMYKRLKEGKIISKAGESEHYRSSVIRKRENYE